MKLLAAGFARVAVRSVDTIAAEDEVTAGQNDGTEDGFEGDLAERAKEHVYSINQTEEEVAISAVPESSGKRETVSSLFPAH